MLNSEDDDKLQCFVHDATMGVRQGQGTWKKSPAKPRQGSFKLAICADSNKFNPENEL